MISPILLNFYFARRLRLHVLALQYLIDFASDAIVEFGIDVFRVDFNAGDPTGLSPCATLPCWRSADAVGRHGMTEVRHVEGLYRLWDTLISKFAARDLFGEYVNGVLATLHKSCHAILQNSHAVVMSAA